MFEVFVKVTSKTVWCKRKLVQTFFILLFLGGGSYTLKLAFSPSSSISPTAPTVAPAVAAAAVAVSNGANPLGPIGSPVHLRCMAGSPISIVTNGVKELNGDSERNGLSPEHLSGASP